MRLISIASIYFVLLLSFLNSVEISPNDFLLKNYTEVAIATDLEPDDVLALATIFDKANKIYEQSGMEKYPIDLVIVGEGNTTIKKMRMEKLLQTYFDLPSAAHIQVVEGKATRDNVFPYDGYEFFDKESMEKVPFPHSDGSEAVQALEAWASQAKQPFIIQLKPAPELAALSYEATYKTTVLFYGSFNLRKTAEDREVHLEHLPTLSAKLEVLLSSLSNRFYKLGIIESYSILRDQSCVCEEVEWTHPIAHLIAQSDNLFVKMFRTLSANWNAYILHSVMEESKQIIDKLSKERNDLTEIYFEISELQKSWDQDRFVNLFEKVNTYNIADMDWKAFMRNMQLAKKVTSSEIQFTLSDVLVALANTDESLQFEGIPIKAAYKEPGFLVPVHDPQSNIFYYQSVDPQKLSSALEAIFKKY